MNTTLTERILGGDVRSAGRLMRWVDDDLPEARHELAALYPHTGRAYLVGVTGNPGSGKSTLVNALVAHLRASGKTVGVVAVDPTSPFSGGAILGDRVRMQQHSLDRGVFIRSVATRGNLGGISRSTPAMVQVLDAMGFDVVIIETVGVGQDEVDIVRLADTNIVVTVPGLGDDVQAEKAGLMEIADIFVINKSDQTGADRLLRELRTMLHLRPRDAATEWTPPVLKTIAVRDEGIDTLLTNIEAHTSWLSAHGARHQRDRTRAQQFVRLIVTEALSHRLNHALASSDWQSTLDALLARTQNPHDAADALLNAILEPR
ncbi:MAG: methylmalonyl Co-A mutase-associated GTPase MeaB [Bradymonadaceae bacterium]|nr:methylmalonyl Co-A mutase-associated GTPase MeaB [Lujinxingiaceae bacterium]